MTTKELITPSETVKDLPYNLECGTLKSVGSRVKYNNKKQSKEVGKKFKNYYYHSNRVQYITNSKISNDSIESLPNNGTEKGFFFKATNDAYFGKYLLNNHETPQKPYKGNQHYLKNKNCTNFTSNYHSFQASETFSTTPISSNESSLDIYTNSSENSIVNKVFDMYIQSFAIQDFSDAEKIYNYNKRMIARNLIKIHKRLR
ncbi:Hypothetical protein SRAE_1000095400 [Strongyloides ratti]|uniref:Uncharacterized protein n=1 Tax=Strongyloides ratti TaxID=34506 RepID=A0A090L5G1_STRRB|nr:Hypothetical protein SRAE_1000095400 [Strongyloides ratti]CEF62684.1 Hypothetical protein SRAE_1000095400 [Strongyloides ratti]